MMVLTRKYLVVNLAIVVMNVTVGVVFNMAMFSREVGVRERYVVLPDDDGVMDGQVTDEPPTNWTEPIDAGGCRGAQESRRLGLDPSRGLLDKSRVFKTHPFAVAGEDWVNVTSDWQVCMSTQASVDLLFWVAKQAEMWAGPISVAVFAPDADYNIAIRIIKYLKACNPEIKRRVSFHISYPEQFPPRPLRLEEDVVKEYNCDAPELVNQELVKGLRPPELTKTIKTARYPQNLLRNVARGGCPNTFTFTPDVDMIPNKNMAEDLNDFLSLNGTQGCEKCAFVIPTYEIHIKTTANPTDKDELKKMILRRRAQRFHVRAFPPNQANSNLIKWERKKKEGELRVLYNITTWKNYWEPIYITKAHVPTFDERFVGYGFTRNSQVFEMHVADYTWHMLNNVFLSHRGFQTSKKHSAARKSQINENAKKYKVFRKELYARYGKNESDYEPKKKPAKKKKGDEKKGSEQKVEEKVGDNSKTLEDSDNPYEKLQSELSEKSNSNQENVQQQVELSEAEDKPDKDKGDVKEVDQKAKKDEANVVAQKKEKINHIKAKIKDKIKDINKRRKGNKVVA